MEAITDAQSFWMHLEEYPGLDQMRPDNEYAIWDSSQVNVLQVSAVRGPPSAALEELKGVFTPGPSIDAMIGRYMEAISRMTVYGIRGNGLLGEVLKLYRHVLSRFPTFLLFDERARRTYDESSFANHVEQKG